MLLTRIYLRNFRVYEDELDLRLPEDLVGIYGSNGSGKSTLLESIVFTLWGRSRTRTVDVRTSGVGGDCVTEVEFRHEGHDYLVRRILTGINSIARAEAHCDGLMMATGARDTTAYVHSVLGLDDLAFRSSVFAEQNQIAAFSSHKPEERRRLVLQLLGITPLDRARDKARKDARMKRETLEHLRSRLPDADKARREAEDAEAAAGAADATAKESRAAAEKARGEARAAEDGLRRAEELERVHQGLVAEGKAARSDLDRATDMVAELEEELASLERSRSEMSGLEPLRDRKATLETELGSIRAVQATAAALHRVVVPEEPPPSDLGAVEESKRRADEAARVAASLDGQLRYAEQELERAEKQASSSASLSAEGECPVCGQPLGSAFVEVRSHRESERKAAAERLASISRERDRATEASAELRLQAEQVTALSERTQRLRDEWERASEERARARKELSALAESCRPWSWSSRPESLEALSAKESELAREVSRSQEAASALARLLGRLEREPAAKAALARAEEHKRVATSAVEALRERVRSLGYDRSALESARTNAKTAMTTWESRDAEARTATSSAVRARAMAEAAAKAAEEAARQHDLSVDLETETRHISRLGDLLAEFRNTIVATVGPRLATQAAELFNELTDREYDQLQVDPETYELQISDAGTLYGMDRFSGSERDLANLALRVAISEQVRFQSGGMVGLLVLDEVFGPLDEGRKHLMLQALQRLKGRFQQILVVTHDPGIKDQLPNAIEVVKLPGRRATARLLQEV